MSSNNNNNNSRNPYSFPDFSLRRLLLQGARAARGSPQLGTRLCDIERGSNGAKIEKAAAAIPSTSASSGSAAGMSPSSLNKISSDEASQHSLRSPFSGSAAPRLLIPSSPGQGQSSALDCPLCYNKCPADDFYMLLICNHYACRVCLVRYLMIEILESRTDIACPQCTDSMHPSDIHTLLSDNPTTIRKYEDFMVRRVLLADPDSRWCPAPDCSYAVIASGCASCPRIKCERPGCDINFCYHCKAEWHPDQTCDAARASRHSPIRVPSGSISQDSQHRDEIKPCPRCQVLIVKMDDGSCNHMVCAVCGSEFCWLCMKVISDLHYLSPSGCTFWGKKPWSRKKKLLWQLGTLVGAPVGIALVAGIAVPAMIIGIPVWVGRKVHSRYLQSGKHKRNCAVMSGVIASVLVSPVLAGLAVAIGVPILLFYVYGVVPVSLCRAGCGVSTSRDGFKFDFDDEGVGGSGAGAGPRYNPDASSVDAVSRIGATSIGEVSLSVASGSHNLGGGCVGGGGAQSAALTSAQCNVSRNLSTTAMAGSIAGHRLEVEADISASETASALTCESEKSSANAVDTASTRALAGSIFNYRQVNSTNGSEDGASERVRFDNVCYVIDDRKDIVGPDGWSNTLHDQEMSADKSSVGSCRSFRSSDRSFRDDPDSVSLSSLHKRIMQAQHRLPKYSSSSQRSSNPSVTDPQDSNQTHISTAKLPAAVTFTPEPICCDPSDADDTLLVLPDTTTGTSIQCSSTQPPSPSISTTETEPNQVSSATSSSKSQNGRNVSKLAALRSLFFSQNPDDTGSATGGSIDDSRIGSASKKDTNLSQ